MLVREATSIDELIEEVTPESIFMTNNEVDTGPAHPQVRSTVDYSAGSPGVGPVGAVTQPGSDRRQQDSVTAVVRGGLRVQRRSVLRNVEPVTSITPTRTKAKEKKQMINQTETTRRPITDRGVYRTTPTQNEAATGIRILREADVIANDRPQQNDDLALGQ